MRESQDIVTAGVPNAMHAALLAKLTQIANNTMPDPLIMKPNGDYSTMSGWTASDAGTTAWNLLDTGVDTPEITEYIYTESYSEESLDLDLSHIAKDAATHVRVRVLAATAYISRTFGIALYLSDHTEVLSVSGIALGAENTPEIISATATGNWTQADLDNMYLIISASSDQYGQRATVYEAEVQVF